MLKNSVLDIQLYHLRSLLYRYIFYTDTLDVEVSGARDGQHVFSAQLESSEHLNKHLLIWSSYKITVSHIRFWYQR